MADWAYSSTIQADIALTVMGVPNSSLLANEKATLDGTWTTGAVTAGVVRRALQRIQQMAQAFYQAGAANAPDVWEHLLIAESCLEFAQALKPNDTSKIRDFAVARKNAWDNALESFTVDSYTASSLAGQNLHIQGIRFYVLSAGVKLPRRKLFSCAEIDAETQWVLNYCWNRANWRLRQRQARMKILRIDIADATWTESTKTLTKASGFTTLVSAAASGCRVRITAGTNVLEGEYVVASKTSDNAIVLTTSLSSTAGDLSTGDIDGVLTGVSFVGLGSSETFDSISSRKWFYDDTTGPGSELAWMDSDEAARQKSLGEDAGRPVGFHTERRAGVTIWHFAPEPDTTYYARGEVLVAGPGTPGTATETTVFDKFPAAMRPHLRDLVLARVYTRAGVPEGERIYQRAVEDIQGLFPQYEDPGASDDNQRIPGVLDRDFGWLAPDGVLGGEGM